MKKKKINAQLIILSIALGFILGSCKKDSGTNNPPIIPPISIKNIVTQSMIDSLTAAGAVINSGTTPPVVNGIYLMHPDSCIYDNSPGNYKGQYFDDYKFQFSNQNNSLYTITVAQKDVATGVLNPNPTATYITGSGNAFSIYILSTSTPSGIAVQKFNVFSGTLTSGGIQNFQNTLYMRSKTGDPNNTVAPAGTIRVFNTGAPGLAAMSTSF